MHTPCIIQVPPCLTFSMTMRCKFCLLCLPQLISRYSNSTSGNPCAMPCSDRAVPALYLCSCSVFCLGAFLPQCPPSKLLLLLKDPAQVDNEHHCLSLKLSYFPREPQASLCLDIQHLMLETALWSTSHSGLSSGKTLSGSCLLPRAQHRA